MARKLIGNALPISAKSRQGQISNESCTIGKFSCLCLFSKCRCAVSMV